MLKVLILLKVLSICTRVICIGREVIVNIWLEKYQELVKEEGSSLQLAECEWVVDIPEKLMLAGQHVPYSEMTQVYDERLRQHDDLANEVDNMPDSPERDRKLAEHAAACDYMSRLISVVEAAGHTVTHSDAVYGFGK